jgi:hypothetical protein
MDFCIFPVKCCRIGTLGLAETSMMVARLLGMTIGDYDLP